MAVAKQISGRYEILDHTGDIGLRIWSPTPEGVLALAARGMVEILAGSSSIHPRERKKIQVEGEDLPDLLVRWLNDLNFLFSTEGFLPASVERLQLKNASLDAEVAGELFDPERHEIYREIKAATYHDVRFEKRGEQWFAQVIFDL